MCDLDPNHFFINRKATRILAEFGVCPQNSRYLFKPTMVCILWRFDSAAVNGFLRCITHRGSEKKRGHNERWISREYYRAQSSQSWLSGCDVRRCRTRRKHSHDMEEHSMHCDHRARSKMHGCRTVVPIRKTGSRDVVFLFR